MRISAEAGPHEWTHATSAACSCFCLGLACTFHFWTTRQNGKSEVEMHSRQALRHLMQEPSESFQFFGVLAESKAFEADSQAKAFAPNGAGASAPKAAQLQPRQPVPPTSTPTAPPPTSTAAPSSTFIPFKSLQRHGGAVENAG